MLFVYIHIILIKLFARKRSRDEDGNDSMPLSKRINNLHIDNPLPAVVATIAAATAAASAAAITDPRLSNYFGTGQQSRPINVGGYQQQQHQNHSQHQIEQHHSSGAAATNATNTNGTDFNNLYNPELGNDENPFYYNKNKLLYDLHVERMQRGGVPQ